MIQKIINYCRNGNQIYLKTEKYEFVSNSYNLINHPFKGWNDFDNYIKTLQNGFVAAIDDDEIKVLGFGAKKAVIAAYGTEEEKTAYAAQIAAREAAQKAQEEAEALKKAQEEAEALKKAKAKTEAENINNALIDKAIKFIVKIIFEDDTEDKKENLPEFSLIVNKNRFKEIRNGGPISQEGEAVITEDKYNIYTYYNDGYTSWEEAIHSHYSDSERESMIMTNKAEYEARKAQKTSEQTALNAKYEAQKAKDKAEENEADLYAQKIEAEISKAYKNFNGTNKEFYHKILKNKYNCYSVNYDDFSVLIFIGGPECTRWFKIN